MYIVYTYNIMNIYLYRYHYARFTDRHRILVDYTYYNVLLHARTNTRVYRNRDKHGTLSVLNLGTFLFFFPQHDNFSNTLQYLPAIYASV